MVSLASRPRLFAPRLFALMYGRRRKRLEEKAVVIDSKDYLADSKCPVATNAEYRVPPSSCAWTWRAGYLYRVSLTFAIYTL